MDAKKFYSPEGYLFKLKSGEVLIALPSIINPESTTNRKIGFNLVDKKCLLDGSYFRDSPLEIGDWDNETFELVDKDQYTPKYADAHKIIAYKDCKSVEDAILIMLDDKEIVWDYHE